MSENSVVPAPYVSIPAMKNTALTAMAIIGGTGIFVGGIISFIAWAALNGVFQPITMYAGMPTPATFIAIAAWQGVAGWMTTLGSFSLVGFLLGSAIVTQLRVRQ